jgi:hypothetical protein
VSTARRALRRVDCQIAKCIGQRIICLRTNLGVRLKGLLLLRDHYCTDRCMRAHTMKMEFCTVSDTVGRVAMKGGIAKLSTGQCWLRLRQTAVCLKANKQAPAKIITTISVRRSVQYRGKISPESTTVLCYRSLLKCAAVQGSCWPLGIPFPVGMILVENELWCAHIYPLPAIRLNIARLLVNLHLIRPSQKRSCIQA